ncbi:MAG: hypothetical protein KIY10_04550 [Thermoplasmata archaeon]|nr:hypothetical protein [Candidatus Sysuiplasma jiujiangense]MBX8641825.1 hypothetical protein [Candidatus Sysuiplasma jiujiangense]
MTQKRRYSLQRVQFRSEEQVLLLSYYYISKVKFPNDHAKNPVELGF